MADRSNINLNAYATTGQSVGSGTTIYAGKCDINTLQFKSISSVGSGISIGGDSDNIIISGATGGVSSWGTITGTLSNQTDLQTALDDKLFVSGFTGYSATTQTTLIGLRSDIDTVSGQTDINTSGITQNGLNIAQNTSDIVTISGKTIDNLQPGILNYNVLNERYEPYSGESSGLTFYTCTLTTCPTGLTRLGLNGRLVLTEIRLSTGNTNTSHVVGDMYWDTTDHTLALQMSSDVSQQVGQEVYVLVKNNTGSQIENGKIVLINGSDGNRPTVALARANSIDSTIVGSTIGMATEDIETGTLGFVTSFGLVRELDNTLYDSGDVLYLSTSNSGDTQNTKPNPPDFAIKIGVVANNGNPGTTLVTVTDVTDLTGVTVTVDNGLTKVGNNISFGGSLTGNTTVGLNSNTFSVTGTNVTMSVANNITTIENICGIHCSSIKNVATGALGVMTLCATDLMHFCYDASLILHSDGNDAWACYANDFTPSTLTAKAIPNVGYVTGQTTGTVDYLTKYNATGIEESFLFETGTTIGVTPYCALATCNANGMHIMAFATNTQKLGFYYTTGSLSGPRIFADGSDTLKLSGSYVTLTANNHVKINTSGSANNEMIIDKTICNSKDLTYVGGDGYGQGNAGISVGLIAGAGRSTYNTDGGDAIIKPGAGDGTGSTGQILLEGATCVCDILYPKSITFSNLPAASGSTGGVMYVSDCNRLAWSDGTAWRGICFGTL